MKYELLGYVAENPPWKIYRARARAGIGPYRSSTEEVLLHHLTFEPRDRREREMIDSARQCADIESAAIERIIEWEPGSLLCTTELFSGWRLDIILDQLGPLPVASALWLTGVLAEGLQAAHGLSTAGIAHRSVISRSVIITTRGAPILRNPGLIHVRRVEPMLASQSSPIVLERLSPEQASGAIPDIRSDVFQLGLLLYEMLIGESPFHRGSPLYTIDAIVRDPVPKPSQRRREISGGIDSIILKSLKKNPGDRFQTMGELREALGAISGMDEGARLVTQLIGKEALALKPRLGGFL